MKFSETFSHCIVFDTKLVKSMATATLDDYSKITANVTKLSVSVRDLSKYTESIGTPKDSRDLRCSYFVLGSILDQKLRKLESKHKN